MLHTFTINPRDITPYFIPKSDKLYYKVKNNTYIGEELYLPSTEIDGCTTNEKKYKCVGQIDSLHGVNLDAFIVKEISNSSQTIFSLTKDDCKHLNIPFEKGLQLLPKSLPWQLKEKECDMSSYDPEDLSQYPFAMQGGKAVGMIVKISGFTEFTNNLFLHKIVPPNFPITDRCKSYIKVYSYHTNVPVHIVTKFISPFTQQSIIDIDGCMYLDLDLRAISPSRNLQYYKNKSLEDLFVFRIIYEN